MSVLEADEAVVSLAGRFAQYMKNTRDNWDSAFMVCAFHESHASTYGSCKAGDTIDLFDAFKDRSGFFDDFRERSERLRALLDKQGKAPAALLLTLKSDLSYSIDFENSDPAAWTISKMNGQTGLPVRRLNK